MSDTLNGLQQIVKGAAPGVQVGLVVEKPSTRNIGMPTPITWKRAIALKSAPHPDPAIWEIVRVDVPRIPFWVHARLQTESNRVNLNDRTEPNGHVSYSFIVLMLSGAKERFFL